MHPNPEIRKIVEGNMPSVIITDALKHSEFRNRLARCRFVITDSGGVQEEAHFFGKQALVCRKYTERHDPSHILCDLSENDDLLNKANEIIRTKSWDIQPGNYYGDGTAIDQTMKILYPKT